MKTKHLKNIIVSLAFVFIASFSFAQMLGPEDPGNGPEAGDPPVGGGAPLSGGVILLLTLGTAYGGKKVYHLVNENSSDKQK